MFVLNFYYNTDDVYVGEAIRKISVRAEEYKNVIKKDKEQLYKYINRLYHQLLSKSNGS